MNNQLTNYPILMNVSLMKISEWLPKENYSQIVIITDTTVKKFYGTTLQEKIKKLGVKVLLFSFPAGEKYKNAKTKETLENRMLSSRCDRDTLVIALGGGVVGDMAGFIAATYMRGVAYLQIPTTLLAMVDSSIGGKTGINTIYGKNLIGSIYRPMRVVADLALLKTLPRKHLINGLVEAIKMFLTHDSDSFWYTDKHLDKILKGNVAALTEVITRAIHIKSSVVARDEMENGERSTLNFGHTIGHALEKITDYKLLHGYAVAYGILIESNVANLLGLLPLQCLYQIKQIFIKLGFSENQLSLNIVELIKATKIDKKTRHNEARYVLLQDIGSVYVKGASFVHPVPDRIVKQVFKKDP